MTALEYMTKKNKIVKRVTNETLIPEKQLVEVYYNDNFSPANVLLISNCPYCNLYYTENHKCSSCPMSQAGNNCFNKGSSFKATNGKWYRLATEDDNQELLDLGIEYQRSNECYH